MQKTDTPPEIDKPGWEARKGRAGPVLHARGEFISAAPTRAASSKLSASASRATEPCSPRSGNLWWEERWEERGSLHHREHHPYAKFSFPQGTVSNMHFFFPQRLVKRSR